MSTPNRTEYEARSYELDAYGHVNNAVFVNWLEHSRLCYLRDRGMTYESIPRDLGVHVVVVRQDVVYKRQVRLGDRLVAETTIERVGRTSFTFAHTLTDPAGGPPAATATVTMVCVGSDGKSTDVPDPLRRALLH